MHDTSLPQDTAQVKSYSQWGEDLLVWEFFDRSSDGIFLEAGAFHPTVLSQTYLLEQMGWSGVLVEPSTDHAAEFRDLRPRSQLFQCALGSPEQSGKTLNFIIPQGLNAEAHLLSEGEVPREQGRQFQVTVRTLAEILEEAGVGRLDYLSLDLEGHELGALRGMDFKRWPPRLILIEDHLHTLHVHRYLQKQGFALVYRKGSNNWYVPKGTPFPKCTPMVRLELFRKLYLSMPFRKLRVWLKNSKTSGQ